MHTVLTHPLVKHRVTLMRDINTKPKQFRELVNEITEFLAIESLKDLRTVEVPVVTPVAKTTGVKIEDSIVIVPILGLFLGKRVRPVIVFCVALAMAGLYLLTIKEGLTINKGDLLILACAFFFSLHILVIDHFSPRTNSVALSAIQLLITGIISVPCMIIFETINWNSLYECAFPIFYAGVMSCGVAYTMQIVAQKYTEPAVASLLLSLESVFAALAGAVVLGEVLSGRELTGCIIMFAAIILAQLPEKKYQTRHSRIAK